MRPAGFGGNEKITEDTDADEEGQEDHCCNG